MDEFYQLVEKILNENRGYYNIIMGDWNSKVGSKEDTKRVMGQYGIEAVSYTHLTLPTIYSV